MDDFIEVFTPWFGNEDCSRIVTQLELENEDGRE